MIYLATDPLVGGAGGRCAAWGDASQEARPRLSEAANDDGLEVIGFGEVGKARVIGALAPVFEDLKVDLQVGSGALEDIPEIRAGEVVRARGGDQDATAREELEAAEVEFFVAAFSGVIGFFVFDEGRRVEKDQVEGLFGEIAEEIKGIAFEGLDLLVKSVAFGILLEDSEGGSGSIDRGDRGFGGGGGGGEAGEPALVGADFEDRRGFLGVGTAFEEGLALVEKGSGFLTLEGVDQEALSGGVDDQRIGERTKEETFLQGKFFDLTDFDIIAFDDGGGVEVVDEDRREVIFEGVAGGAEGL